MKAKRLDVEEDVELFFELIRLNYAGYKFYKDKVDLNSVERGILDMLTDDGLSANIHETMILFVH